MTYRGYSYWPETRAVDSGLCMSDSAKLHIHIAELARYMAQLVEHSVFKSHLRQLVFLWISPLVNCVKLLYFA